DRRLYPDHSIFLYERNRGRHRCIRGQHCRAFYRRSVEVAHYDSLVVGVGTGNTVVGVIEAAVTYSLSDSSLNQRNSLKAFSSPGLPTLAGSPFSDLYSQRSTCACSRDENLPGY